MWLSSSALLPPEPLRHCDRVKPHARADSKRGDAPCFCLFENRNSRDGQHVREFVSRKSMTSRFEEMAVSEPLPLRESAVDDPTSRCRQRLSSRNARSSWVPVYGRWGWSQRLPAPLKRPSRPEPCWRVRRQRSEQEDREFGALALPECRSHARRR